MSKPKAKMDAIIAALDVVEADPRAKAARTRLWEERRGAEQARIRETFALDSRDTYTGAHRRVHRVGGAKPLRPSRTQARHIPVVTLTDEEVAVIDALETAGREERR